MEHQTEGELLAYLDDELALPERVEVERHLKSCERCAAELDVLSRGSAQLTQALARFDAPASIERAAAAVSRRVGPLGPRPSSRTALVRAAVLILCMAGAAGAALPGSPVRGWVEEGWQQTAQLWRAEPDHEATATVSAEPLAAEEDSFVQETYLSVLPAGGTIRIILQGLDPSVDALRVRWVDSDRASVHGKQGAEPPSYHTGTGMIRVEGGLVGDVVIELPRSVERASIEADGRTIFSTDTEPAGPTADRPGTELVLPLRR